MSKQILCLPIEWRWVVLHHSANSNWWPARQNSPSHMQVANGQTTRKAVFACNAFSKWYSDPLKQSVSGAFCWKAPLWVGWNAADCVARHLRKMPVISEENNNNYFCNQIDQRLVFRLIVSALAAAWSSLAAVARRRNMDLLGFQWNRPGLKATIHSETI